jgi:lysophospholipase L1-like esterase
MRSRDLVLAALAIVMAAGCSSGSSLPTINRASTGNAVFSRLVGVGDSLTAGEQSGALLGATGVTSPLSGYPGGAVPPGQPFGFWSILYQRGTGTPQAAMFNPAVSPLPLIRGPGLGSQLVITPTGSIAATQSPCSAFNNAGFATRTFGVTRMSVSQNVFDLGVPGITAHEALYMTGPLTGPASGPMCTYPLNPADPTSELQAVVSGESGLFLPVLGAVSGVTPLTEVNAAAALHPSLTTVWLGANDLLKYTFTGGRAPVNSPGQMQSDITQTIRTLQSTGSRVVVANLPEVLDTPQFFRGGPTLTATLEAPPFSVPAIAATAVTAYIAATYGVGPGGYLTETGFFKTLATLKGGSVTPVLSAPGDYLVDAFAAQVRGLNAQYNAAIASAAVSTGAPLVDIHGLFTAIKIAGGIPVNPPFCCTLGFGGGLLSIDGLHPSNTGYALIANAFIQTIDKAFGATATPLSAAELQAIAATDPYAPPAFKKDALTFTALRR